MITVKRCSPFLVGKKKQEMETEQRGLSSRQQIAITREKKDIANKGLGLAQLHKKALSVIQKAILTGGLSDGSMG